MNVVDPVAVQAAVDSLNAMLVCAGGLIVGGLLLLLDRWPE